MKSSYPGRTLPPEIREEIPLGEHAALEDTWRLFDSMPEECAIDEGSIPVLAQQMRTFLCAAGALPEEPSVGARPRRGAWMAPIRQVRILPLRRWQGYAAIAACVIVLIAIGVTLNSNTIKAPYGEEFVHRTLADGSTLLLNSGTKIRVVTGYNRNSREVLLMRGEVLFDVKQGDIPFTVRTDHGTVEVLGTSFSVRSWPTDAEHATAIAVASGIVRVTAKSGSEYILEAGDAMHLIGGGSVHMAQSATDADNQLSWVRKSFKFSNHLTGDILEELERRYDVNVQVEVEGLEKTRSGLLLESPQGPTQILNDLCELHDCAFVAGPDDRAFRIVPR